ncbi:MAG: AAA family ATPase [Patescibacteria group bacterium]
MKIIGIAGTNGSGKDSLGQILDERHGYLYVSVTDILREGLRKQDLPIERENMRNLSAQWRRERGLGVLIDKALEIFEKSPGKYKGLAIASLRNPGEADRVHELGGTVVWVDAEPKIRYDRIHSRQRSAEDQKTFEEFLAEEQAEMNHSGDEATLNVAGVKVKADIFLENNGNLEEFQAAAEKALNLA